MEQEKRWISPDNLFPAIEELLAEGRQAVFTVTGMSMWPFLCHGRDQVIVERCCFSSLKTGDIVLFQTPLGNYMLHRITDLGDSDFETTGDGNCFRDGRFPSACIKAKACTLIRKGAEIPCDALFWRIVFGIWSVCFPIRSSLLRILKKVSQLKAAAKTA